MRMELLREAVIGQHFAVPLEYGDVTGLSDEEERLLRRWVAAYPNASFVWCGEDEFAQCEITGLKGACVTVEIYGETR
jgi:hypothetical protein